MRAVKKTRISFGLVSVPVRMFKAIESHDISFRQHHGPDCLGNVGLQRVCKECGKEVAFADIAKGIEHDGVLVIITPEELASLDEEQGGSIDVLQFVQQDEIDPSLWEAPYFLEPDASDEGYALLRQILDETNRVAVVKFVLRTKTHLGIMRAHNNVLMVHTMLWPDEVRSPAELKIPAANFALRPQAVKMALLLVESMLAPFEPDDYVDGFKVRLDELISAKAANIEFAALEQDLDVPADVADLMAALEESVKRHPAKGKREHPAKVTPRTRKAPVKVAGRKRGAA